MKTISTKKELSEAIKAKEDLFVVTGKLAKQIKLIKGIKVASWLAAIGGVTAAIVSFMTVPAATAIGAVAGPVGSAAGAGAISFKGGLETATVITILGIPTTTACIELGVALGGIAGLTTIRDKYEILEERTNGIVIRLK